MLGENMLQRTALACASPFLEGDARPLDGILSAYCQALTQIAAGHCAKWIDLQEEPFKSAVKKPGRRWPWDAAWHPALAELERRVSRSSDEGEIWDALAALYLNLAAAGKLRDGTVRLSRPQRMWWQNNLLPAADKIRFHWHEGSVHLATDMEGKRFSLDIREDGSVAMARGSLLPCPSLRLGRRSISIRLATEETYPLPRGQSVWRSLPHGFEETIQEAASLIRKIDPSIMRWIAKVIGILVPLETADGVKISATVEEYPGMTFVTFPLEPNDLATRLIHEASHHYYLLFQRFFALHDGSDTTDYHSPIKERSRKIDMILFAFHAFGNGALLHRELSKRDSRHRIIAGETLEQAMAPLHVMHGYLRGTRALTDEGKTLWHPLAGQLFS